LWDADVWVSSRGLFECFVTSIYSVNGKTKAPVFFVHSFCGVFCVPRRSPCGPSTPCLTQPGLSMSTVALPSRCWREGCGSTPLVAKLVAESAQRHRSNVRPRAVSASVRAASASSRALASFSRAAFSSSRSVTTALAASDGVQASALILINHNLARTQAVAGQSLVCGCNPGKVLPNRRRTDTDRQTALRGCEHTRLAIYLVFPFAFR
jgi:hypothetical protein